MSVSAIGWALLGLSWGFFFYLAVQRWRSVRVNPARQTLPWVIAIFIVAPWWRLAGLPFNHVNDGPRRILMINPGFSVVRRGDAVAIEDGKPHSFLACFVAGRSGDRVVLSGKALLVNGAPMDGFPWAPLGELSGCEEQTVSEGQLAVVAVGDPGNCSSIELVDAARFRGREVLVDWPPWEIEWPPRWKRSESK